MSKPKLEFVEVSARDGLQNEPEILPTAIKLDLIDRIARAGFARQEAGSFVNPKRVPQMADTPEVFAALKPQGDRGFIALALNPRGVARAVDAGAREINYVFCATDGFSIRNNGASVAETLAVWPSVSAQARAASVRLTATISTAFGCPFDGETPLDAVLRVRDALMAHPPSEIALADTIGVAAPSDVKRVFAAAMKGAPGVQWRAHFHNTRNTALANALAAVECGVRVLDGSLAGIGGCPFAPGAAGNVPTEDLLYMFDRMGFDIGVDFDAAVETARFIAQALGRQTPGMVSRAGRWPPPN